MLRLCLLGCALLGAVASARPAQAQSEQPPLPAIDIIENRAGTVPPPPRVVERYQMPQTVESITAERIEQHHQRH